MLRNFDNCFYCQSLGNNPRKIGRCAFCGIDNPLYLVFYKEKGKNYYFCCGCAGGHFPRSKVEKEAEEKGYKEWKSEHFPK